MALGSRLPSPLSWDEWAPKCGHCVFLLIFSIWISKGPVYYWNLLNLSCLFFRWLCVQRKTEIHQQANRVWLSTKMQVCDLFLKFYDQVPLLFNYFTYETKEWHFAQYEICLHNLNFIHDGVNVLEIRILSVSVCRCWSFCSEMLYLNQPSQ